MDEAFEQLFEKSEITFDLSSEDSINKAMIEYAYFFWNAAWLESARRTREECCETIRAKKVAIECAIEFEQAYNYAIDDAIQAIRATIKEEPSWPN